MACNVLNGVLSHLYDVDGCNNHVLNGVLPNVQQMLQFVGGRPRLVRGEKSFTKKGILRAWGIKRSLFLIFFYIWM